MAYSQVDPNISNMNPADRNNAAIRAGYTGWDDYLNNRATTQSQFSGGSSFSGSSGGGSNWEDVIKRSQQLYSDAIQPAIASQRAAIPEIQANYGAQKANLTAKEENLKQRYDNLIGQIRSTTEKNVTGQTKVTAQELGKRGLLPSSTLAQQEIQNATAPLRETGMYQEQSAVGDRESGLLDLAGLITQLTGAESKDVRSVYDAIANLQSGAATSGIDTGKSIWSTQSNLDAAEKARQTAENSKFDVQGFIDKWTKSQGGTSSDKGTGGGSSGVGVDAANDRFSSIGKSAYPIQSISNGVYKYSDGSIRDKNGYPVSKGY